MKVIEEQLKACNGQCEYPLYIKGSLYRAPLTLIILLFTLYYLALILRLQGRVEESLTIFQAAVCLNPHNISNLKQVGRSLYLLGNTNIFLIVHYLMYVCCLFLGKHKLALEVFTEAERINSEDREV